jgi:hypothetical protein
MDATSSVTTFKTYFESDVRSISSTELSEKIAALNQEAASYKTMEKVCRFFSASFAVLAVVSILAIAVSAYHLRKIVLLHVGIGLAAAVVSYGLSFLMNNLACKKESQQYGLDRLIDEIRCIRDLPTAYSDILIDADFPKVEDGIDPFDVFLVVQTYKRALNTHNIWSVEAIAKAKKLYQFLIDARNTQHLV